MMRFKICGLRDIDSALVSADAGASLLGFAFVHGVRRQLTLEQGQAIIPRVAEELGQNRPGLVGLFADQDIDEVNHIIEACGLDYAQLCGSETPDYWERVRAKVIRQTKVKTLGSRRETVDAALAQIREVVSRGNIPQLDSYKEGAFGGTGHAFDWDVAARLSENYDVVLAGGLTPDNVTTAIRQVDPWMVDVSSGVETDGVKHHAKIRAFAQAVKSA